MIVKTRYRDIPWVEAKKCFALMPPAELGTPESLWNKMRGTEVIIRTPAKPKTSGSVVFKCDGPFFALDGEPETGLCPHIAEIGD